VTDAYVVLGWLDPDAFLGGEMRLDPGLARQVMETISKKVGLSPEVCALGIIRILEAQMVGSLRLVSIERGHDPRDFTLFACGGAGGMHAASLARELGAPRVISPQLPAHLAPWGILTSDLRESFSRTDGRLLSQLKKETLTQSIAELREEGASRLGVEGFDPSDVRFRSHLELRYVGQRHTVKIPFDPGESTLAKVAEDFHQAHHELYGYSRPRAPVELVTLRLDAEGILEKPNVERLPEGKPGRGKKGMRQVWLDSVGSTEVPIYDRELLVAGERIEGPAIIEETASSTLLYAGQSLQVSSYGMLEVEV
jgi:N-methylhydantoinase A